MHYHCKLNVLQTQLVLVLQVSTIPRPTTAYHNKVALHPIFIELLSRISNGCIQYLNLHQFSPPVTWCWSRWTVYLEATDLLVTSPVVADLPGEREKWKRKRVKNGPDYKQVKNTYLT